MKKCRAIVKQTAHDEDTSIASFIQGTKTNSVEWTEEFNYINEGVLENMKQFVLITNGILTTAL